VIWFVLYIGTIFAANWSIGHLGACSGQGPCVIPVGFGLLAPSGVLWAGLAFTLRDLTQDALGRRWTIAAIVAGALLSATLSGPLALASGVAFLLSELADFAVYERVRKTSWLLGVGLSNTVGLLVDSALFLTLAFGSLQFLAGQVTGKAEMTLLALPILWALRWKLKPRALPA
jgi:queuosine precursor transporter